MSEGTLAAKRHAVARRAQAMREHPVYQEWDRSIDEAMLDWFIENLENGTQPTRDNAPELPDMPLERPIEGDSHRGHLAQLERYAHGEGWTVVREDFDKPSLKGEARGPEKQIALRRDASANEQFRCLVHELAHAHGIDYRNGHSVAEVVVETIAMMVCDSLGLDTGSYSLPYILHWDDGGDLRPISECGDEIDGLADRLTELAKGGDTHGL